MEQSHHEKKESVMNSYFVQSGPLTITIVAPTAHAAAIEAVQWWGEGPASSGASDHRRCLAEQIDVRRGRKSRLARRFPTFNLLAVAQGESPAQAWERLLQSKVGGVN